MQKVTDSISPINVKERQELDLRPGDTVRVWQKIQEKDKYRLQAFEGLVIARKHGREPGATFTVRKVSSGIGVEKIFPLYSPMVDKIEIVRRSKVRRAKLYYILEKAAREARRILRRMTLMDVSTSSDLGEKEKAVREAKEIEEKAKREEAERVEAEKKAEEERLAKEAEAAKATEEPTAEDAPKEEVVETTEAAPQEEEKKEEAAQ